VPTDCCVSFYRSGQRTAYEHCLASPTFHPPQFNSCGRVADSQCVGAASVSPGCDVTCRNKFEVCHANQICAEYTTSTSVQGGVSTPIDLCNSWESCLALVAANAAANLATDSGVDVIRTRTGYDCTGGGCEQTPYRPGGGVAVGKPNPIHWSQDSPPTYTIAPGWECNVERY
jgi:hypothetical protein